VFGRISAKKKNCNYFPILHYGDDNLKATIPIVIMIDLRRPEIVKYFKYLGSMTTDDIRCTLQIKSRIAMAKAESNK
jgi:hypothetical protein